MTTSGKLFGRLFHCSEATGIFGVKEVDDFCQVTTFKKWRDCQDDLVQEDVFILDAKVAVYVWLGKKANKNKTDSSHVTAGKMCVRAFMTIAS